MKLPPSLQFSRNERRGIVLLLVHILFVIGVKRMVVPWYQKLYMPPLEVYQGVIPFGTEPAITPILPDASVNSKPLRFIFDPNIANYDDFIRLGFKPKVAHTIINYISKGGEFREASDLLRIYGVDTTLVEELYTYIRIAPTEVGEINAPNEFTTSAARLNTNVSKLDINSADSATLMSLSGIGPVLAGRIIRYRNLLGGYYQLRQLSEVYGINDSLASSLAPYILFDSTKIHKILLNEATYSELIRHPYLKTKQVQSIMTYRRLMKAFNSTQQLVDEGILEEQVYLKVSPYLTLK